MQFTILIAFATALAGTALAAPSAASFTTTVSYDNTYDASGTSLDVVACSNGRNGLETKGFTTFGSLPTFPFIGGAPAVKGWNDTNCGTCWALTFNGKTIKVLAIDVALNGFNIAQKAMDNLTNGHAVEFGRVDVTAAQVAASQCGL